MKLLTAFLFFAAPLALHAQASDSDVAVLPEIEDGIAQSRTMTPADGAILGIVEGFTEFLPISSTGHLIVANELLDLNSDAPAVDSNGDFIRANGGFYTVKDAASAYTIIIQIAAIIAVVFVYWKDVASMLAGLLGRDRRGLLKLRNLIAAFVPAAVAGLFLHRAIETYLFSVYAVVFALVAGAFAMFWVQKKYAKTFNTAHRSVEL
ncbi:MAG: undecaprenyl-diphosphate phosphatase, partial [Opitutales bacterium]|nr:undecaprenyl-diphosphate phosphatase [Opitutales bacterium]